MKRRCQRRIGFLLECAVGLSSFGYVRFALAELERSNAPETSTSNAATPPVNAQENSTDSAARDFVETCSGCHTIGGGASRGPDLSGTREWPVSQLTGAIEAMQRKVGPLAKVRVEALTTLLKDPTAQKRTDAVKEALLTSAATPNQPPNSLRGGGLFFGQLALTNGGMPCSACHLFHGEGGNLAPELTAFARSSDVESLANTISRAQFLVMRPAYQEHPITASESRDIAAFLKEARTQRKQPLFAQILPLGLSTGLGAFLITMFFVLNRPKSVRARLIERATKR